MEGLAFLWSGFIDLMDDAESGRLEASPQHSTREEGMFHIPPSMVAGQGGRLVPVIGNGAQLDP
ncbi:hypothetical protein ACP3V9_24875, partial [Salmonella enterica]|uniref:hypothetical protein n=1 Tax=Salmonella enterica TaxID=28901 RepID=UPI003CF5F29C